MLSTRLSLDSLVMQSPGIIVSDMDGEKVMMSVQKGKYYNLGAIGGLIWDKIKSSSVVSDLIDSLIAEYNVEYNECKEQVITFLENLHTEGLIQIKE